MTERSAGRAGLAAVAVFWPALFAFAAAHPGYSHFTQAISELGAVGAPHALAWNLIGFIVTGLLLAVCGAGLAFAIDGRRSALWWLLVFSGLGFVGAGVVPTEMQNGSPQFSSPLTICHIFMSFVSGIPWLIATLLLVSRIKQNPNWRRLTKTSVLLALLGFTAYPLNFLARSLPFFDQRPGLAQRIFFAVYFGWYLAMSCCLLRQVGSARGKTGQDAFDTTRTQG